MEKEASEVLTPSLKIDYYFILAYYGLLAIVLISNIIAYQDSAKALMIGIILPLAILVITLSVSFMSYFHPQINISEELLSLSYYISTGLVLIFCDGNLFSLFFSNPMPDSYLPSMNSLMILSFIGPKKLVPNRRVYLLSSFFLAVLSFILNCFCSQKLPLSVFQFLILLLSIVSSSQMCHSAKVSFSKSVFMAYRQAQTSGSSPSTIFEEIVDHIQSSSEKLMDLYSMCDSEIRHRITESLNELTCAFRKLTTNINIYQANIEAMGKNMDSEDKQFIEQNFIARVSSSYQDTEEMNFVYLSNSESSYGVDQLTGILKQIGAEWNFDTFFMRDLTGNCPIKVCGEYVVKRYHIAGSLNMNLSAMSSYLNEVEIGYFSNPYHNNCHGADVMCSFLYLISASEIIQHMTSIELLATIIATVAHDVGHPGVNNRMLIMTRDKLAVQYNDISVLENMHSSTVFTLLAKQKNNFLAGAPEEMFIWFRKVIIEMILATDMAKYFDQLGYFKAKYINDQANLEMPSDKKLDYFKLLVKCSDVGHAAKKIDLHEKWCGLIMEEFFQQGEKEKELKLSVSMFCDKLTTNIPKSQAGFIRNIVMPLYSAFNTAHYSSKIEELCIRQLDSNIQYWEHKLNNKHQTEGFESDRAFLVVPNTVLNPRRGSMPLLYS